MKTILPDLPAEHLRLVEEVRNGIAADQRSFPLTDEQRRELDRRLEAWEAEGDAGRPAEIVLAGIRKRL